VLRLLTLENLRLLRLIHHRKPDSVGALCQLSGRAQPNISRSLASLGEAKLVKMVGARPKRPELVAQFIAVDLTKPPIENEPATSP
jgi:predicted transcriptional regulator